MIELTVIVCTHNPHSGRLARTFEALVQQDLEPGRWELVVIDNGSDPPIGAEPSAVVLPVGARVVREPTLGLTRARIRGITEAKGALLVLVDDDNVLAPDYLRQALKIAEEHPRIGAWGGRVLGEFEIPPPDWAAPHLYALALRDFTEDSWASWYADSRVLPCGAGMCVRAEVARRYAELVERDPLRARLDRTGAFLSSSGDTDLALTAIDAGMGIGQFTALAVHHLIPRNRLTEDYFQRLFEGMGFSATALLLLRHPTGSVRRRSLRRRVRWWKHLALKKKAARRFHLAFERGRKRALRLFGS